MSDIQRELDGCWEKVVELEKKNEELAKRNEELEFRILYHNKEIQSLEKEEVEVKELKRMIKEWMGWGDWLRAGKRPEQESKFIPFEEARTIANSLNLKNNKEWRKYCSSKRKQENIPSDPDAVYKNKGWISWGDFLGTRRIATKNRNYISFTESKKFIQSLQLRNQRDWSQFCKSGNKQENIPSDPQKVYKKEWKGYGDWLGTRIGSRLSFLSFDEARKYVHTLQLSGKEDWDKYCKSNKRHLEIPANPSKTYKNKGWKSFGDWLGTGTIAPRLRKYRSFEDAKKFVHALGLKNQKTWLAYSKSGKKPHDIPANPNTTYKNKGWISWGDWTGSGNVGPGLRKHKSFADAREFVHSLGLKSANEWRHFSKSGKFPKDIPYGPNLTYKNKGWSSWGDFLGTGTLSTQDISQNWLPWKEAKTLYQKIVKENNISTKKQWQQYIKTHRLPKRLPAYPEKAYTKERIRKMMK